MDKIVPFKPGHFDLMDIREVFNNDPTLLERCNMRHDAQGSFSYTFIKNGRPIACVGMDLRWPGVGEIWTITTELVLEFPKYFHSCSKKMLDAYVKEMKLYRLQSYVHHDYEIGIKWAEALEFKQEAVLKKFGPEGEDYILLARIT